ncbi:MAG: hypothetical protein HFG20_11920 [Anaerotruncus sp.]|jgi:hypothetical protein|nr:hypothetical protein [Anaerotruncus sp.]
MQYCENCRLKVAGARHECPLCQGALSGNGCPEEEIYPQVPFARHQYRPVIRLMVFLSAAAIILCGTANYLFFNGRYWSLFVAAAIGSMWVSLSSAVLRRHNLPKSVLWQVFWLSLLAVLWDLLTGWHHWALDYVVPILCSFGLVVMAVLARLLKLHTQDFLVYLMIDGLFGILPALFLVFGWVQVVYPSAICVAASLLSFAAVISFGGDALLNELRKRLHL